MTPTIAEDLDTLEAFFGAAKDGARWQLPNCGDYFNGAEIVARMRAELERPSGGPREITANIGRVLRLAYKVDAFEAGEGKLDGVADLLRKLAAALRRDVDGELARLRAEVERLRQELADEKGAHAKTADNFEVYAEGVSEDLERLTRERDTWEERAEHLGDVVGVYTARAETAERERDDARRALIRSCFGSAEYADIRKPGDPAGIRARSHREAAECWGWTGLYPGGGATECETLDEHVERLIADLPHNRATTGGEP